MHRFLRQRLGTYVSTSLRWKVATLLGSLVSHCAYPHRSKAGSYTGSVELIKEFHVGCIGFGKRKREQCVFRRDVSVRLRL